MADERKVDYALSDTENEKKRLREQSKIIIETTRRVFALAGIEPGMRVLELGTGAGDVTILLSEMVGPAGEVVSLDKNPEIQESARKRAQAEGRGNVKFVCCDIATAEPEGAFDALAGRAVLMYIPSPEKALTKLLKSVRSGGVVAFQEVDFTVRPEVLPPMPLMLKTWDL